MIVVTVNNMKFDLLFCVGVCSKIVYMTAKGNLRKLMQKQKH